MRERDGDEPSLGVEHGTAGLVAAKRRRNAHHSTADAERGSRDAVDDDSRDEARLGRERVAHDRDRRAGAGLRRGRKHTLEAASDVGDDELPEPEDALRIDGPFNFQYIVSNGRPHVIEANPRMGGGTDLSVAAGADLPRYLLERVLTGRLSSAPPAIREGLVMSRYHDAVFFAHPPEAAATAPRMSLEAERAGQIAI